MPNSRKTNNRKTAQPARKTGRKTAKASKARHPVAKATSRMSKVRSPSA